MNITRQSSNRRAQIADGIRRELSSLIAFNMNDPRLLGMVSVTRIELFGDYAIARVYITVLEESSINLTLSILNGAKAYLRKLLAQRLNLRTTPALCFYYDHAQKKVDHLVRLIDEV